MIVTALLKLLIKLLILAVTAVVSLLTVKEEVAPLPLRRFRVTPGIASPTVFEFLVIATPSSVKLATEPAT